MQWEKISNIQNTTALNKYIRYSVLSSPPIKALPKTTYLSISYFWRQHLIKLWIHFQPDV